MRPSSCAGGGRRLERPHRGRADGDDPLGAGARRSHVASAARGSARCACGGRSGSSSVIGLERVEPDDQLDRRDGDAAGLGSRPSSSVGQVQAGRRRRRRARLGGVHGLVALGVGQRRVDVRRQRDLAVAGRGRRAGRPPSSARRWNVSPAAVRRPTARPRPRPSSASRCSPARSRRAGRTSASQRRRSASTGSSSSTSAAPAAGPPQRAAGPGAPGCR